MDANGVYNEEPFAYLINPAEFDSTKKLSDFDNLTLEQFPAMYGAWLCMAPIIILDRTVVDCMRFLPDSGYSKNEDFGFQKGQKVKVMTYLTSRGDANGQKTVMGNESLKSDGL